jgi:DNA-binding NtrC family response regulator
LERETFRTDLYYRLNGFTLSIPPLRERPEDLPALADFFLKNFQLHQVRSFSSTAIEVMKQHSWPGNVRELENTVRRAGILAKSEGRELIQIGDLPHEMRRDQLPQPDIVYHPLEEQILSLLRSFKFSRSSITETARALDNRDRGTITEYFRGMCFEALCDNNFDVTRAAGQLCATEQAEVVTRVQNKIRGYLDNVKDAAAGYDETEQQVEDRPSFYKGLPKKYHPFLNRVLENFDRIS